jgi:hypothetical protein
MNNNTISEYIGPISVNFTTSLILFAIKGKMLKLQTALCGQINLTAGGQCCTFFATARHDWVVFKCISYVSLYLQFLLSVLRILCLF